MQQDIVSIEMLLKLPTHSQPPPSNLLQEIEAQLAAKRAEVQAKLAQMRAKAGIPPQPSAKSVPAPTSTSNMPKIPGLDQEDLQRRIAEAKARIASASQAVCTNYESSGNQQPIDMFELTFYL
jgi:DNA-binding transcriptional MerR regulator